MTYSIAEGISLDPSTTYALHISNSTYTQSFNHLTNAPFVGETTSSDQTGLSGWSIANNSRYRPNGGEWSDNTRNSPLRMTLKGSVNPYIAIAADRSKATGKLDEINYTLTRGGGTTAEQVVVTLTPPAGNDWNLPSGPLVHVVTFNPSCAL